MILNIPHFDEAMHKYTVYGCQLPSVTGVITDILGVNPYWTDEARERGTFTHKAIHYYADGDLDPDTVDPEIRPRLDAYVKFRAETGFEPDLVEQPLYHPTYRYCGIPDQVQFGRVIIDYKNGAHQPQYGLQLAAYAHLLPDPYSYDRWCVLLKPDGNYKIEPYRKQDLQTDFNYFISFLNSSNWRKQHGR